MDLDLADAEDVEQLVGLVRIALGRRNHERVRRRLPVHPVGVDLVEFSSHVTRYFATWPMPAKAAVRP